MGIGEWLLKNGEQVTIVGILAFEFVFGCIALYKKWIVIGWVHKDCEGRLSRFEEAAVKAADKANERIELLEAILEDRQSRTTAAKRKST